VPVEAAGVRQGGHPGRQREFAEAQLRIGPLATLQPRLHLRPGRHPNRHIVERRRIAFDDDAFAARVSSFPTGQPWNQTV
jgi:hypothetical protein